MALLLVAWSWTVHLHAQSDLLDHSFFEETKSKAEKGNSEAQFNLGFRYYSGHSIFKEPDVDWPEAVKWFQKAADQGHIKAQRYLGNCYQNGSGVIKDSRRAVDWYRKAAEQEDAQAQDNLGSERYGVLSDRRRFLHYQRTRRQGLDKNPVIDSTPDWILCRQSGQVGCRQ